MYSRERNRADANTVLAAAYVIGRRADDSGKRRTFVAEVLIKTLTKMALRWKNESDD